MELKEPTDWTDCLSKRETSVTPHREHRSVMGMSQYEVRCVDCHRIHLMVFNGTEDAIHRQVDWLRRHYVCDQHVYRKGFGWE